MKAELIEFGSKAELTLVTEGLDGLLLDENGRIRLFPAEDYRALRPEWIRAWSCARAFYGIPTLELIDWLKARIGDRKAIEIGAGNGDLGFHLGILQTDSGHQTRNPASAIYYSLLNQVPTHPREDVVCIGAEQAVQKYKPDVVIGSWITRKFLKGIDQEGKAQANIFGPVEEKILRGCAEYIHIGNLNVHSQKTLLQLPHEVYEFPWLVSRAADQSLNRIWVWKNPHYPKGGVYEQRQA